MKKITALAFLAAGLAGCGVGTGLAPTVDPGPLAALGMAAPAADYFPMVNGDTWAYQSTLEMSDGSQRTARYSATWADVVTQAGRTTGTQVIKNDDTTGTHPANIPYVKTATEVDLLAQSSIQMLALPLAVGTSWDPNFSYGALGRPHMAVAAREDVTVPAGTYPCLRVDMSFAGKVSTRTWYAPGVGEVREVALGPDGAVVAHTDLLKFTSASAAAGSPWSVEMAMEATDGDYTVISIQVETAQGRSYLNIRSNSSDAKDFEVWQDGKRVAQASYGAMASQLAQAQLESPADPTAVQQAIAALRQRS